MNTNISDIAIGVVVISCTIATVAYFLMRGDDCLDKASAFISTAPAVSAKAGKIISVGTSSWLSGQTAARTGERSFYFLIRASVPLQTPS
ncbi:MAG: hypothetical protein V4723_17935 [Pseudomonadota bacterium]